MAEALGIFKANSAKAVSERAQGEENEGWLHWREATGTLSRKGFI